MNFCIADLCVTICPQKKDSNQKIQTLFKHCTLFGRVVGPHWCPEVSIFPHRESQANRRTVEKPLPPKILILQDGAQKLPIIIPFPFREPPGRPSPPVPIKASCSVKPLSALSLVQCSQVHGLLPVRLAQPEHPAVPSIICSVLSNDALGRVHSGKKWGKAGRHYHTQLFSHFPLSVFQ